MDYLDSKKRVENFLYNAIDSNENYDLITEGLAKIRKQKTIFYNPAQKTNRDISLLVIREYFKEKSNIKILDAMSATGLRGIRYLKEINNTQLYFNDINENAIDCIKNNLLLNGFNHSDISYYNKNIFDIKEKSSKINIIKSDCNVLMCTLQGYFDVIDIDPFGSCSEYIENTFRAIKHNGILCFTSTDKGVLITNESKCIVKYETIILKKFSQNEMALRSLLSCISRHASKFGISIEPLISLSLDFYLRVFVKVIKRSEKRVVTDNGLFYLCNCGNSKSVDKKREVHDYKIIFKYFTDGDSNLMKKLKSSLEDLNYIDGINCNVCKSRMKVCGPFWNKGIHSQKFVLKLKNILPTEDHRIVGIFNYLEQELNTMWYYEIGSLCKVLKNNCIKNKEMLNALKNLGFDVSITHCNINAFKTNAPLEIVLLIVQIGNNEKESAIFSDNKFIEALMSKKYYKGLIASKLGPLALPE